MKLPHYYTPEALASQPPVCCPVQKAKAGDISDLPLLFLDPLFREARIGPERIRNVKQPNARRNLPR